MIQAYWTGTVSSHEKNALLNDIAPAVNYGYDPDRDIFVCPHCGGVGLFPSGNGGILHKRGCVVGIIKRYTMAERGAK